ncbi:MAG: hypothetical protein ACJAWR_001836 [Flavobacteriales bacterium]|jgi:hypothetical protein
MPQTVQEMLNETNPNIKIDQSTFPGISLISHLDFILIDNEKNNRRKKEEGELTATEKKIIQKKWDVVIMQEGTVRLLIPEVKDFQVNPAIDQIKSLINNPDCRFIIFNTWASKTEYPKKYCYPGIIVDESLVPDKKYCSPIITNIEQELELINSAYKSVADKNNIEKTDNGNLFYQVEKISPEIELLEDEIHPSELGAFLNACVFYQILTDKKAADLNYYGKLDRKIANQLKNLAEKNYR